MSWVVEGFCLGAMYYISRNKLGRWELHDRQHAYRFDTEAKAAEAAKVCNGRVVPA